MSCSPFAVASYYSSRAGSSRVQWFADPFADYASQNMPEAVDSMLRWCEMLWARNGTYRMALERVAAYFLTRVEFLDDDDQTKEQYDEYMHDTLDIISQLRTIALDFLFYGNSFSSYYSPPRRHLRCLHCRFERPLEEGIYVFRDFKFYGSCPSCNGHGEMELVDRPSYEADKLEIIRWNPHLIKILYHPLSHRSQYLFQIPGDLKANVRAGKHFHLLYTPKDFLDSIKDNTHFAFAPDSIFHMKEDTLAGLQNRGWGIPRAVNNFHQAFYIQVLRRYNEALAMDYVVPWRVLSPQSKGGELDPLLNQNMGRFKNQVRSMVAEHRQDPLSMHAFPFPLEYQVLGGEARELAPNDLITLASDDLLNACGVPAELYRGTLQAQAVPPALRLFEATWPHLTSGMNNWINWLLKGLSMLFNWPLARGRLTPVTRADDIEARMVLLQLAAAQKISDTTALQQFNINPRDEIRRRIEEQRILEEETRKAEKDKQQAMEMEQRLADTAAIRQGIIPGMPGGVPPGGTPPGPGMFGPGGGGDGGGRTPSDTLDQADQMAQQLLAMPEAARKRQLRMLRESDDTMHAVVSQRMKNMRDEASSVGREQVLSQMTGAQ